MEHVIDAEVRTQVGKGNNKRLRRNGKMPAVVYGHEEPLSIALDERNFIQEFKTISESTIVRLKLGKESRDVLVRDFQEDVLTGRVLHVDFYEIEKGKGFLPGGL